MRSNAVTTAEFDEAIAAIIQRGRAGIDDDATERVFVAAAHVARHRRNMPDDQPFRLTDSDVIGVLTTADRRQRKLIKKIAEELIKVKESIH